MLSFPLFFLMNIMDASPIVRKLCHANNSGKSCLIMQPDESIDPLERYSSDPDGLHDQDIAVYSEVTPSEFLKLKLRKPIHCITNFFRSKIVRRMMKDVLPEKSVDLSHKPLRTFQINYEGIKMGKKRASSYWKTRDKIMALKEPEVRDNST